jgi:hypothetical protein
MAKTATKNTGKKRGPPLKQCRNCGEMVHAAKRACPKCGTEFPKKAASPSQPKISRASTSTANGSIDVGAVLTIQALLKTMDAGEIKRMVDDVANTQIPF